MTQKKRRMSLRGRIMVLTLTGIIISVLLVGCVSMARGMSQFEPGSDTDAGEVLARADARMYEEKRAYKERTAAKRN